MKTKFKLPIAVAIAAMCAALAFALTACAVTPEKLTKKLAEEDATYTVTRVGFSPGDPSSTDEIRVSGKQIHAKITSDSGIRYFSLIQEGEKYYTIEGTDEELIKTEISKEEYEGMDIPPFQIRWFKAALEDYNTYFEKSGEIYKLKADKMLAFLKIVDPDMTELPDGNIEFLNTIELKFENDKITVTMGGDELMTLVFSEIGTTKFEPFTDTVPTLQA